MASEITLSNAVAITGMILDVLGAIILARSFVVKRPGEVFCELRSLGIWDFHISRGARDLLLSWLVQALEARTGAAILVIGFLLQAESQVLPHFPIAYQPLIVIVAIVGGCSFLLFFVLPAAFVRRAARHAIAFYDELESETEIHGAEKSELLRRREELKQIQDSPRIWLNRSTEPDEPIDRTLTSNE